MLLLTKRNKTVRKKIFYCNNILKHLQLIINIPHSIDDDVWCEGESLKYVFWSTCYDKIYIGTLSLCHTDIGGDSIQSCDDWIFSHSCRSIGHSLQLLWSWLQSGQTGSVGMLLLKKCSKYSSWYYNNFILVLHWERFKLKAIHCIFI